MIIKIQKWAKNEKFITTNAFIFNFYRNVFKKLFKFTNTLIAYLNIGEFTESDVYY